MSGIKGIFKNQFLKITLTSLIAAFACTGIIYAATTIGADISTTGTLDVTGAATFTTASSTGIVRFSQINSDTGTIDFDNENLITTGNIGIGTSSPYAKLSVVGEIVGSYFTATSTTATSTFANGIYITSGCFRGSDGNCISAGGGAFTDSGSSAYYLSGNVGMGINTPQFALDVVGEDASSNTVLNVLQIRRRNSGGVGAAGIGGAIRFLLENDAGTDSSSAIIKSTLTNAGSSSARGTLELCARLNGNCNTTIKIENENVDITGDMAVAGDVTLSPTVDTAHGLDITFNRDTTDTNYSALNITYTDSLDNATTQFYAANIEAYHTGTNAFGANNIPTGLRTRLELRGSTSGTMITEIRAYVGSIIFNSATGNTYNINEFAVYDGSWSSLGGDDATYNADDAVTFFSYTNFGPGTGTYNFTNASALWHNDFGKNSPANMNITNNVPIRLDAQTVGTNRTYLLMGTAHDGSDIPTGNYGIYDKSGYDWYTEGEITGPDVYRILTIDTTQNDFDDTTASTVYDTLTSYDLPANTLLNVGDTIRITQSGRIKFTSEPGETSVQVNCYFGANNLALNKDSGAAWASWVFKTDVIKTGSNTQVVSMTFMKRVIGGDTTESIITKVNYTVETDTSPITIKCTGQTDATDPVGVSSQQFLLMVEALN